MGSMSLSIENYTQDFQEKWDRFVLGDSFNGTFLQTRNFLNYHRDGRFDDCSIIVRKGTSDIVAVLPAAKKKGSGGEAFDSHPGSTFGGIVFSRRFYNSTHVMAVLELLESWLTSEGFSEARLKQTSQIFCSDSCDLLDYCLFANGWSDYKELSFVINLEDCRSDILSGFSSGKRRDYRYSLRSGLAINEIGDRTSIGEFHRMLSANLLKHDAKPVHTVDELMDLRERLNDSVAFYGVDAAGEMVAGAMVFRFERQVLHAQYLAAKQDKLSLFPSNFLDTELITIANKMGFKWFSFGISTEDHGRILNTSLAKFKEGFGATYCNNRTYLKSFAL